MAPIDRKTQRDALLKRPWRWHARVLQALEHPLGRVLDFGCGDGRLLVALGHRATERHGVDVRCDRFPDIREAQPDLQLEEIGLDGVTKYPDDYFDTITIVEVIEHVGDERRTLHELGRILKPGGKLLLTTPHRGLLTFLDIGNVKFVFPRVHRFAHRWLVRRKAYYEQHFEQVEESHLVGDITVTADRRAWHRHYKPDQIEAFCPPSLKLVQYNVYFPAMRFFMLLRVILRVCCASLFRPFPPPLPWLENRLSQVESATGDQLVMLFEKRATS